MPEGMPIHVYCAERYAGVDEDVAKERAQGRSAGALLV